MHKIKWRACQCNADWHLKLLVNYETSGRRDVCYERQRQQQPDELVFCRWVCPDSPRACLVRNHAGLPLVSPSFFDFIVIVLIYNIRHYCSSRYCTENETRSETHYSQAHVNTCNVLNFVRNWKFVVSRFCLWWLNRWRNILPLPIVESVQCYNWQP